jgi:2-hydroxychromene-2-carboxylate isomerase
MNGALRYTYSATSIPMKVSWVFDVISPFAYLNLTQLPQLPPHVEVEYVPVLLAGLLNHHGQIGPAEMPTKRRFTYRFALWGPMRAIDSLPVGVRRVQASQPK